MTLPASTCPNCGTAASGRFCSSCGTALAGASCTNCAAPLTPGARFCHRCGTPSGTAPASSRSFSSGLPWAVAAIALVALIALVVGQRFGARNAPAEAVVADSNAPAAGPAGAMPRAPDISQLTPAQRAERLFYRIMKESEAGNIEAVRPFAPMAIPAYEMIAPLDLDQRYDLGRIGV